jgi:hypothetical protein
MDVLKGEAVEHELDAMVRRRHDARVVQEGERPAHEAWMESERREDSRRREEKPGEDAGHPRAHGRLEARRLSRYRGGP